MPALQSLSTSFVIGPYLANIVKKVSSTLLSSFLLFLFFASFSSSLCPRSSVRFSSLHFAICEIPQKYTRRKKTDCLPPVMFTNAHTQFKSKLKQKGSQKKSAPKTYSHGSGGIRTHAPEETGALIQRLRPLGHATCTCSVRCRVYMWKSHLHVFFFAVHNLAQAPESFT